MHRCPLRRTVYDEFPFPSSSLPRTLHKNANISGLCVHVWHRYLNDIHTHTHKNWMFVKKKIDFILMPLYCFEYNMDVCAEL